MDELSKLNEEELQREYHSAKNNLVIKLGQEKYTPENNKAILFKEMDELNKRIHKIEEEAKKRGITLT